MQMDFSLLFPCIYVSFHVFTPYLMFDTHTHTHTQTTCIRVHIYSFMYTGHRRRPTST
jgi:hypothetical protein